MLIGTTGAGVTMVAMVAVVATGGCCCGCDWEVEEEGEEGAEAVVLFTKVCTS